MSPSLGVYPTRRPRGRIHNAECQPACARAIRAGGVDPIPDYLRLRKDTSAGLPRQLGFPRIDCFFPPCAEGLAKYRATCASVHRGSLQILLARPEAQGFIWAYLGAEVQGSPDHVPLQWLSLANAACGLGLPLHAQRVA